jgi:aryl-alcohol dehydrogenase-like predicted oxidoreductase
MAIETALDLGITTIDTAPAYGSGHAEELVGRVIKGKRDRVIVATKCGLDIANGFVRDLTPAFLEQELENSLRRLGTDYIDLYQPHWPDPDTPVEYTMEALERFHAQGKIRAVASRTSAAEISEVLAFARGELQPPYSLLSRRRREGDTAALRRTGLAMIPYARSAPHANRQVRRASEIPEGRRPLVLLPIFHRRYCRVVSTLVTFFER